MNHWNTCAEIKYPHCAQDTACQVDTSRHSMKITPDSYGWASITICGFISRVYFVLFAMRMKARSASFSPLPKTDNTISGCELGLTSTAFRILKSRRSTHLPRSPLLTSLRPLKMDPQCWGLWMGILSSTKTE